MSEHRTPPVSSISNLKGLVEAYLSECQSKGLKPMTLKTYRKILVPFSEFYQVLPTREQIKVYCENYVTGCRGTKEQAFNHLASFDYWCRGVPRADRKPCLIPDNATGLQVKAFIESRANSGLTADSLRWYKDILVKFAEAYPDIPLTPEPVEDFIGSFNSSDERRHGAYRAVKAFYTFMKERHGWISDPLASIRPPVLKDKVKIPLTLEQIYSLLEHPAHDPETRRLLYVLADTGCRVGEVVDMLFENITQDSIKIDGKTGERIVPISAKVRDMLLTAGNKGRVFPKTVYRYRRLVSRAFRDAGLPGSAHLLRHSFAALWDSSDLSLKQIGGWKTWQMVEHYAAGRTLEKAKTEHRTHSPIAKLYGNHPLLNQLESKPDNKVIVSKLGNEESIPETWDLEVKQERFEMLFYWHSLLHNITGGLAELFKEYANKKTSTSMSYKYVVLNLFAHFQDDKEDYTEAEIKEVADNITEQFWENLAELSRRESAREYLSAASYQDLSSLGSDYTVEEVKLDPAPIMWKAEAIL